MKWPWRRRCAAPSQEAVRAREHLEEQRAHVHNVTKRRDAAADENRRLLDQNHFADRIRRLYTEGA